MVPRTPHKPRCACLLFALSGSPDGLYLVFSFMGIPGCPSAGRCLLTPPHPAPARCAMPRGNCSESSCVRQTRVAICRRAAAFRRRRGDSISPAPRVDARLLPARFQRTGGPRRHQHKTLQQAVASRGEFGWDLIILIIPKQLKRRHLCRHCNGSRRRQSARR